MKYLGVEICNSRDCFRENRKKKMKLARRMMNVTYSVTARSCQRMMIGKTFWKNVILPGVLSSSEVSVWRSGEKKELQTIENGVWRRILKAPDFTPVAALQGEVGCSSVLARDIRGKIKFARYLMNSENSVARRLVEQFSRNNRMRSAWSREIERYLDMIGLDWRSLGELEVKDIVASVNSWESERWRNELESKRSLGCIE